MTCIQAHMRLSFVLEQHMKDYSFSYICNATGVSLTCVSHTYPSVSSERLCFFPLFEKGAILNFSHLKLDFSGCPEMSSPALYLHLTAQRIWNHKIKTFPVFLFSLGPFSPGFLLGSGSIFFLMVHLHFITIQANKTEIFVKGVVLFYLSD